MHRKFKNGQQLKVYWYWCLKEWKFRIRWGRSMMNPGNAEVLIWFLGWKIYYDDLPF